MLHDWIAGDHLSDGRESDVHEQLSPPPLRVPATRAAGGEPNDVDDFNREQRLLEWEVARRSTRDAVMQYLAEHMSPSRHHTAAGLWATRLYAERLG